MAAGLVGNSLGSMVTGTVDGTGGDLSGGVVSAFLAAGFGLALWRELQGRRIAPR